MNRTVRYRPAATMLGMVMLTVASALAAFAADPAPWESPVEAVDGALGRGDQRAARDAWQHAYAVALASGRWEGLAAVGDASARIGHASGDTDDLLRARQAYREAFLHARSEGSLDGVLRVSEAYGRLGDHEIARMHRDFAVRLAVRQASPGIFARIWTRLIGR